MADLTDVYLMLATARTIVWTGAGVSVDAGLPSWKGLANEILEVCRRSKTPNFNRIEEHYRLGKYPEMFDAVQNGYGRQFLASQCGIILASRPVKHSAVLDSLTSLGCPILAFFTTNYDDLLLSYLESNGRAYQKYLNDQSELESVDIDLIPSVLKIHGETANLDSFIISRTDYQNWYSHGSKEYFQTFLKAHLARDRFLFIGYSLTDPDIAAILERLGVNLRRNEPHIAILANASARDVESWSTYYNIDVLRYAAPNDNHEQLAGLIGTLKEFCNFVSQPLDPRPEIDLRRAQALYMWDRFSEHHDEVATLNAMQAVVIAALSESREPVPFDNLDQSLSDGLGFHASSQFEEIRLAADTLVTNDWLVAENGMFSIAPSKQSLVRSYDKQFTDLLSVFSKQLSLDLLKATPLSAIEQNEATQITIDALIDVFELRGRDILEQLSNPRPSRYVGSLDVIQTIWKRVNGFSIPSAKPALVHFVIETLFNPAHAQASVLNYLSKAFFCLEALQLDPNIQETFDRALSNRAFLIDDNVLIPLVAKGEDRHDFIANVIRDLTNMGASLFTTSGYLGEVRRHGSWAIDRVRQYGLYSPFVQDSLSGAGGAGSNAFLRGFASEISKWGDVRPHENHFESYVKAACGGAVDNGRIRNLLKEEYDITVVPESLISRAQNIARDEWMDTVGALMEMDSGRPEDERHSDRRMRNEADTVALISTWGPELDYPSATKWTALSLLSSGSSVPKTFDRLQRPRPEFVMFSPEAIWEVIHRFKNLPSPGTDFHGLMTASFFRIADHFIDHARYRSFFDPIIRDATIELGEIKEAVGEILEIDVDEVMQEVDHESIPKAVNALKELASKEIKNRRRELDHFRTENETLAKALEEYRNAEQRRKRYVAEQRRKQSSR